MVCDGISWNGTTPNCTRPPDPPMTECGFEDEQLCGWSQSETDVLDWNWGRSSIANITRGTGPPRDGNWGFAYVDSSGADPNSTAALFSPVYPGNLGPTGACFSLRYSMNGASMGSLSIFQVPEGTYNLSTVPSGALLATIIGDQGEDWKQLRVGLEESDDDFQIVIEATVGNSYLSDFAIDDAFLTEECSNKSAASSTGTVIMGRLGLMNPGDFTPLF